MSLQYKILGEPFMDNAMYVKVNPGQKNHHLLFDLGYGCLHDMEISTIMSIDHVFLSHLHVDHISGFDYFFRVNYNREEKPLHFWVPKGCATTLHKRFTGFTWNLINENTPGLFYVHEVHENTIITYLIKTAEKFEKITFIEEKKYENVILDEEEYQVDAVILNHGIPSIGYFVKEKPKENISKEKLKEHGFNPGPWLGQLKKPNLSDSEQVVINEKAYTIGELKEILVVSSEGENIAYLTDFWVDNEEISRISNFISNCQTLVCETQYNDEDIELADKNWHMTAGKAGRLANKAKVGELVLFHVSTRYSKETIHSLLDDAQKEFKNTSFPENWQLKM